jgi:hypothetical protein
MSKQYGQNRRVDDRIEKENEQVTATTRRRDTDIHTNQLLWSFAVALCLILAALLQWSAPRNALLEQDRAPAQLRLDLSNGANAGGL